MSSAIGHTKRHSVIKTTSARKYPSVCDPLGYLFCVCSPFTIELHSLPVVRLCQVGGLVGPIGCIGGVCCVMHLYGRYHALYARGNTQVYLQLLAQQAALCFDLPETPRENATRPGLGGNAFWLRTCCHFAQECVDRLLIGNDERPESCVREL